MSAGARSWVFWSVASQNPLSYRILRCAGLNRDGGFFGLGFFLNKINCRLVRFLDALFQFDNCFLFNTMRRLPFTNRVNLKGKQRRSSTCACILRRNVSNVQSVSSAITQQKLLSFTKTKMSDMMGFFFFTFSFTLQR